MTKNEKIAAIVIAVLLLLSCSTSISLRSAVLLHSPVSAFTMEYRKDVEHPDNTWYRDLYWITENEPVEKATDGHMYCWAVYKFGPFHFSTYYGEG